MGGFLFKFKILIKAIQNLKNWYVFPLVYFGLINKKYVYLITKSGIKIKIRTNSTDLETFSLIWLLKEYEKFDPMIESDDIIIDVGAHIGIFSMYVSQFCSTGKIFCYEPSKENFELLCQNIELNNKKNIFQKNCVVSSSDKEVSFYINSDKTANSLYESTSDSVKIQSQTLQQIFDSNNLKKCDYLKLDCEGAEYEIIDSLPDRYFINISKIYIEYHFNDSKPELLNKLIKKLEKLSFNIINEPMEQGMGSIFATKIFG